MPNKLTTLLLDNVLNKIFVFILIIFLHYIDEIIWLLYDYCTTTKIKEKLHAQFGDFNLQLVFNSINTKKTDNELEFLDVLYVAILNTKGGFITKYFIQSTAKGFIYKIKMRARNDTTIRCYDEYELTESKWTTKSIATSPPVKRIIL